MKKVVAVALLSFAALVAHADEDVPDTSVVGQPEHPVDNTEQVARQYNQDMRGIYLQQAIERGDRAEVAKYSRDERIAADRKGLADCDTSVRWAEQQLETDDQMAQISGYHNKFVRNQAAGFIVSCRMSMRRLWADYQSLGGKAESPYDMIHGNE